MARVRGIKRPHPLGSVASRSGVSQLTAESGFTPADGVKISELPPADVANDIDQLEVNQSGTSRRVTVGQIAAQVDPLLTVKMFGAIGNGETDDTTAFTAAGASGKTVRVPVGTYLITGTVTMLSGSALVGDHRNDSVVRLDPAATVSMFEIGASGVPASHVSFRNLRLVGNRADHLGLTAGGWSGIGGWAGCSDITVDNCIVEDWPRHGITLDGVTRARISNNVIRRMHVGAGVYISNSVVSYDVHVTGNNVLNTQMANICTVYGVDNWIVTDNICDGTGMGTGLLAGGQVADNITGYTNVGVPSDYLIANNTCRNSQNNGIHVGAKSMIVTGNSIVNPRAAGIALMCPGDPISDQTVNATCANNDISFVLSGNPLIDDAKNGVIFRNLTGFSISGNIVRDAYTAFQIRVDGSAPDYQIANGAIIGNTTINTRQYSVEFNGATGPVNAIVCDSNTFHGGVQDIIYNTAATSDDILIGANNYSAGATTMIGRVTATAGTIPTLKPAGSAADISIGLAPKGTGVVRVNPTLAVGAGSTTQCFLKTSTGNLGLYYGTGDPGFSAGQSSLYIRTNPTAATNRLWINQAGTSTWTNFTTAALRVSLPTTGAIDPLLPEDDGNLYILPLDATGRVTLPLPPAADVQPGWSIDLLAIPGSGTIGIRLLAASGDIINDGIAAADRLRSRTAGAALRLSRVLTGVHAWYVHHKIGNWN